MQDQLDTTIAFQFDNTYKELPNRLFTVVSPTPVKSPTLVQFNDTLSASLGLDPQAFCVPQGAEILSGNTLPLGAACLAQAYAGHQFGHFTMLGDGRAILIGEHITPSGERFDIQLKGAGPTPYSRSGDGRAALGPMLREYLISEAMHALGVPSTRSLAVITTGEAVRRETVLHGAVLTRVAKSHLRVGTFQYAAASLPLEDLRTFANYAIARHFPKCHHSENPYLAFLESVISAQASLIAKWQSLGFVHGVMNTDNMAISGETIDYGPCAFLDTYVPNAVFSSIDQGGRYAYSNQPHIAGWNLARFAESLLPLIAESIGDSEDSTSRALESANKALQRFTSEFEMHYNLIFCQKIGFQKAQPHALVLVSELLDLMHTHQLDFTYTFYALTCYLDQPDDHHLRPLADWMVKWQAHLSTQQKENLGVESSPYDLMKSVNPAVIPYNHQVEDVLKDAVINGNYEPFKRLLTSLKEPYAYTTEQCQAAAPAPKNISEKPYRTFCGT